MKRTERLDRVVLFFIGSAIAAGAGLGLARGLGAFGSDVAERRLITPDMTAWVRDQDGRLWLALVAAGVVVAALAASWLVHQLRRVHSPSQLEMSHLDLGRLELSAGVVADAVDADLRRHPAVADASVHVLGAEPARIDAVVDVHERADLPDVKRHLTEVFGRLQSSLGAAACAGRCTIRLVETPRVTA